MANTYTWSIPQKGLIAMPTLNGQNNVVVLVRYTVTGTDGVYTASINGTAQLNYAEGTPFTPFANLTEAQVMSWVQASESNLVSNTQAQIDQKIANMANPPIIPIAETLPWTTA